MTDHRDSTRPDPDSELVTIADYVGTFRAQSTEARSSARNSLMDSVGCALLAQTHAACRQRLGPLVPGATLVGGARVPGTGLELDPAQAAFNIGTLIRWLDFNDTWLAAEWGHPSDNLGGILAVADYESRRRRAAGQPAMCVGDVLTAMIKAYEIQGILALENAFNQLGLDHVLLVRVATTAVITDMLGGARDTVVNALSNAWMDGGALRAYRHAPNAGPRKSWAAGDACRRAVQLALSAVRGEMGYPSALSAPIWGFNDVVLRGRPLARSREYGSYVMENVLYKIAYPAEFHAQTACEAAVRLHAKVRGRLDEVQRIVIETQAPAIRIIDKTGPLHNPADRDHCLQYMVAVPLIKGTLAAQDYEDSVAADARIDWLRERMEVVENPDFSRDYLDAAKRSIGNAVQVYFRDGSSTERIAVEYPLGHRRRREEGLPLLRDKFEANIAARLVPERCRNLLALFSEQDRLESTAVDEFMASLVA